MSELGWLMYTLMVAVGVVLGMIGGKYAFRWRCQRAKPKLKGFKWCGPNSLDDVIIETDRGSFRGSCAMWSSYPDGSMVMDTYLNHHLLALWQRAKWEREDSK